VAHSAAPALYTHHTVTLADNTQLDTVGNTPFQTTVDIFLPDLDVEIWFLLGEVEGIDTTVEVRVLRETWISIRKLSVYNIYRLRGTKTYACSCDVTCNHDNRASGSVLRQQASSVTAITESVS
jgi:hypothetical protein